MQRAILDTGVMLAALLRRDPHHAACRDLLASGRWESIVPGLCVTEVAQLLERGAGSMWRRHSLSPWPEPTFMNQHQLTGNESPNSFGSMPSSPSARSTLRSSPWPNGSTFRPSSRWTGATSGPSVRPMRKRSNFSLRPRRPRPSPFAAQSPPGPPEPPSCRTARSPSAPARASAGPHPCAPGNGRAGTGRAGRGSSR